MLTRPLPTTRLLAGVFALPMLLAGCIGGGDGESIHQESAAVSASDKTAFDFFLGKGLTAVQAAGIVGNLDQESGMSPTIEQYGGGPGRGIAQWSTGGRWDTSDQDNVLWYAAQQGESADSLNLQLEFIWYELTTFGYGLSNLQAATNVTDATDAFMDYYEICGDCVASNRIAYAEAALSAFGNDAPSGPPTAIPAAPTTCGHLAPGQGLVAGQNLASCDGRFTLAMQADGNLVVYRGAAGAMWAAGTNSRGGYVAVMQSDGNFVVYGKDSNALWATGTDDHGGASLDLQTDGNLVVYATTGRPVWAAGTRLPQAPPAPTACGVIAPNQGLTAGGSLASCDGRYTLAMQTDGNLVLSDHGSAIWAAGTNGRNGFNAVMQPDGNFVVSDTHGNPRWAAGTFGHSGATVAVQEDGNLVVYSGSAPLWASQTNGR